METNFDELHHYSRGCFAELYLKTKVFVDSKIFNYITDTFFVTKRKLFGKKRRGYLKERKTQPVIVKLVL